MCVAIETLWGWRAHIRDVYRAGEQTAAKTTGKQAASIERKLMAHLILPALLLLTIRGFEGGEAFKMMSVEKRGTKNEDEDERPQRGEGCKFWPELSVHYRVIRNEAGPNKGPQCC